jgi:hypothetical protein
MARGRGPPREAGRRDRARRSEARNPSARFAARIRVVARLGPRRRARGPEARPGPVRSAFRCLPRHRRGPRQSAAQHVQVRRPRRGDPRRPVERGTDRRHQPPGPGRHPERALSRDLAEPPAQHGLPGGGFQPHAGKVRGLEPDQVPRPQRLEVAQAAGGAHEDGVKIDPRLRHRLLQRLAPRVGVHRARGGDGARHRVPRARQDKGHPRPARAVLAQRDIAAVST